MKFAHDFTTTSKMIENYEVIENNTSSECVLCNGLCCRNMGCEIFPQDVKRWFNTDIITKDIIIKLLDSKYIQLDWYEGDIREYIFKYPNIKDYKSISYYLHMRNKNDPVIYDSWGGECIAFISGVGCKLTWEQRPTGGKALIPKNGKTQLKCILDVSKAECCLAWMPYYKILNRIKYTYIIK